MTWRRELSRIAAELSTRVDTDSGRQRVLARMFEQRYGAKGPKSASLAVVGQEQGISRQAVLKSISRMLQHREDITKDVAPLLWKAFLSLDFSNEGSLDGKSAQRLCEDLWGPERSPSPRIQKPAPLRSARIPEDAFDALVLLGVGRAGSKSAEGAKMVVVSGWDLEEAAHELGTAVQPVRNAAQRFLDVYETCRQAYKDAVLERHGFSESSLHVGRRPRISLTRVRPRQFEVIASFGGVSLDNPAVQAARAVLVDGARITEAARQVSVTPQRVNEARRRLLRSHLLLLETFGRKIRSYDTLFAGGWGR